VDDLVGSHETLPVAREQTLGSRRVKPRQLFAKRDPAKLPMKLASLLPDCLGDFGNRRQTIFEGTEVEAGATDHNWHPPGPSRHRDLVERQRTPVGDGVAFGSIDKAIEAMRYSLFGGCDRTCSQDPEVAIDLLAVGVDDSSTKGIRQL
jgi:hypothetical protein